MLSVSHRNCHLRGFLGPVLRGSLPPPPQKKIGNPPKNITQSSSTFYADNDLQQSAPSPQMYRIPPKPPRKPCVILNFRYNYWLVSCIQAYVEPVKFRDQRQKIPCWQWENPFFSVWILKKSVFFRLHFFFMKITFFCIFFVESDTMQTKVAPAGCWHVGLLLTPPGAWPFLNFPALIPAQHVSQNKCVNLLFSSPVNSPLKLPTVVCAGVCHNNIASPRAPDMCHELWYVTSVCWEWGWGDGGWGCVCMCECVCGSPVPIMMRIWPGTCYPPPLAWNTLVVRL